MGNDKHDKRHHNNNEHDHKVDNVEFGSEDEFINRDHLDDDNNHNKNKHHNKNNR